MAKDEIKPLVIDGWQNGISLNQYSGFADMRNVEIGLIPGIIFPSLTASKKSSTTVTGTPLWAVKYNDTNSTVFVLDSDGKLYKASNASSDNWQTWSLVSGNTLPSSGAGGQGLGIFKDYVFVARAANLDLYSIGGASWTNSWAGTNLTVVSDTLTHPMLVGQDDILYIGNGLDSTNKLGGRLISIQQVASKIFDPADNTTYLINSSALQLPYPYRIRCLAELGQNLMIGTFIGATLSSQNAQKIGDVFPWNRSAATFNLPFRLFEQGINSMLNVGNSLYISAGQMGNFYLYNGSQADFLFRIPRVSSSGTISPYRDITVSPQGLAYHKNRLFVAANQSGSVAASGIYSINLDASGLVMENTISTGVTDGNVLIGFILPLRDFNFDYLIGWTDGTTAAKGIDLVGENDFNTSYTAFVDSPLYSIGSIYTPRTFQACEIYLDTPLVTGGGVKVSYRYDRNASFTTLATFDFATFGALQQKDFPAGNISGQQVQFRIALTATSGATRLKYIRFV